MFDKKNKVPPNPHFFFTAHSAWCPPMRSGLLEVILKRPELGDPAWKDAKGNAINSSQAGLPIILTITLGGCLNGAQIANLKKLYSDLANTEAEAKRAREFIRLNEGKEKEENFAYLLSKALPKAAILAPMTRNNSAEGIIAPVLYQNGLRWFVSYPNELYKGKKITGIDGYFNATIHPLVWL